MRQQFYVFLLRWVLNSIGIWVAVRLLGSADSVGIGIYFWAGLTFSIVNSVLKPIIVILSLPAILLTLGLFTIVVNGLMVYISLKLVPGLELTFASSILAGIIMSLVNYIVSSAVDSREYTRQ